MIVNTAVGDVTVTAGGHRAGWQSLIRRGMLHSECEGVEYWDLPEGSLLRVRADHGVEEAVLVLRGEAVLRETGETGREAGREPVRAAGAGGLLLVPHGVEGELRPGAGGAGLVVVRGVPGALSRRLPRRSPELDRPS